MFGRVFAHVQHAKKRNFNFQKGKEVLLPRNRDAVLPNFSRAIDCATFHRDWLRNDKDIDELSCFDTVSVRCNCRSRRNLLHRITLWVLEGTDDPWFLDIILLFGPCILVGKSQWKERQRYWQVFSPEMERTVFGHRDRVRIPPTPQSQDKNVECGGNRRCGRDKVWTWLIRQNSTFWPLRSIKMVKSAIFKQSRKHDLVRIRTRDCGV